MYDFVVNSCYVLNRYFHIVFAMLLVGGTLFFEMVVPVAIGELKQEQQLLVLARAVDVSLDRDAVGARPGSYGPVLNACNWSTYQAEEQLARLEMSESHAALKDLPFYMRPKFWWLMHAILGTSAVIGAVLLVAGNRPPDRPIHWMRINLVLLMAAILMASAMRHFRLKIVEHLRTPESPHVRE